MSRGRDSTIAAVTTYYGISFMSLARVTFGQSDTCWAAAQRTRTLVSREGGKKEQKEKKRGEADRKKESKKEGDWEGGR